MVPENGAEKTSRFVYSEYRLILKLSIKVKRNRLLKSLKVLSNQTMAVLEDVVSTNRRNCQPVYVR